jgi:hypothetical protein
MRKCTVCESKHFALGYCRKHHARVLRNGTHESKYDVSGYDELDQIKDTRPGHRGNYAVNIVNDIKAKARARKKEWALNHREAFQIITSACHYCGFKPNWPEERVGIDRIDNEIGYTVKNSAPCCFTCNSAKGIMGKDKFREWVCRVYETMTKSQFCKK